MLILLVILVIFFLLVIIGTPIAVSSILSLVFANIIFKIYPPISMATLMYHSLDSYTLIAIPLFLLAGISMSYGGVSKKIFDFSESVVGSSRGALGNVNVISSMIFGGMSGSSVADVAGLGKIEIKEMINKIGRAH
ncbi:MAG: TRAP transporter large permease subunit, partial [Candidatus Asgardarchaeum sp.]